MVTTAVRPRMNPSWDRETSVTAIALRDPDAAFWSSTEKRPATRNPVWTSSAHGAQT